MRLPCGTPQVTAREPDSSPLTIHFKFVDDRLDRSQTTLGPYNQRHN